MKAVIQGRDAYYAQIPNALKQGREEALKHIAAMKKLHPELSEEEIRDKFTKKFKSQKPTRSVFGISEDKIRKSRKSEVKKITKNNYDKLTAEKMRRESRAKPSEQGDATSKRGNLRGGYAGSVCDDSDDEQVADSDDESYSVDSLD